MAFQLVAEVLDHAPPMTPAERLVLVSIAEFARKDSRECSCSVDDLERRTGTGTTGVRAALRRLAARGLDVRVPLMTDTNGNPVYATRGRVPRYRLPPFPVPPGCECPSCHAEGVTTVTPSAREGGATVTPSGQEGVTPVTEGVTGVTGRRHHSDALTVQKPSYARAANKPLEGSLVQKELARRVVAFGGARAGSNGGAVRTHPFVPGESYRDYRGDEIADCATCGMPQRHRAHARST